MALEGRSKVLNKLNREISKIRGASRKGLLKASILIKERSMKKTPVDEGNLQASHYIKMRGDKNQPLAKIGCTAKYAIYVHENLEARHTNGEAKFLENAIKESEREVLTIIRNNIEI